MATALKRPPGPGRRSRLLLLCDRYPDDLTSGRYLRVHHLCRELVRRFDCYFVDLSGTVAESAQSSSLGFVESLSLPARPAVKSSAFRHLRLTNARFWERAWPEYFHSTVKRLRAYAREKEVEAIVSFAPVIGELAIQLDYPRILDFADSDTLTTRRMLENRGETLGWRRRQFWHLKAWRQAGRERRLIRSYDRTTTISDPDRQQLVHVSGVEDGRVVVVPNGVSEAALAAGEEQFETDRSIAFWGNLDFPPNWTAVTYFYERIFLPFLADEGVVWRILGSGADERIQRIAEHPGVRLDGYQPDLFRSVRGSGAMINPMVEGSGLKNKVLEAFAMNMPVISTSLGVDALPGCQGTACQIADRPEAFAHCVLEALERGPRIRDMVARGRDLVEGQYTWRRIGEQMSEVVRSQIDHTAVQRRTVVG